MTVLGDNPLIVVLAQKAMEKMITEKPICLECGDKIKGRSDKKFCNDACRSAHHNKKNKVASTPQKTINNLLSKNRRISKMKLENKGFVFNFYTHLVDTNKGISYKYCYDFGYYPGSDGYIHIAKYPGTYL